MRDPWARFNSRKLGEPRTALVRASEKSRGVQHIEDIDDRLPGAARERKRPGEAKVPGENRWLAKGEAREQLSINNRTVRVHAVVLNAVPVYVSGGVGREGDAGIRHPDRSEGQVQRQPDDQLRRERMPYVQLVDAVVGPKIERIGWPEPRLGIPFG
jgi:hypothetical protein